MVNRSNSSRILFSFDFFFGIYKYTKLKRFVENCNLSRGKCFSSLPEEDEIRRFNI